MPQSVWEGRSKDQLKRPVNGPIIVDGSSLWFSLMTTRFSEDVVPLADIKANPGRIVRQVNELGRPVLLTSRGRGVAVVQAVTDYERAEEERAFMRAVVAGLSDLEADNEVSLEDARKRLGLV